jgi:hypothetical protein
MRVPRIRIIVGMLAVLVAAGRSDAQQNPVQVYGYFSTRLEKSLNVPDVENGRIVKASSPKEWSQPFFNVMMQYQASPKFRTFVNLNGAKAGVVDVRNLWGEYTANNAFNVRLGKMYRKFGLYNEVLDAVPTYYGIEPPESFDSDHLLISRTTSAMVFGFVRAGKGKFNYSVSTDNGEGRTVEGNTPLGWDVNYQFGSGSYTVGYSGYRSNGGMTADLTVGNGSAKSGVAPWIARDSFVVSNLYAEAKPGSFTFQAEWAVANHEAARDKASVVTVVNSAGVTALQRSRFLLNPAGAVNTANVRTDANYRVSTWYVRGGWSKETKWGEVGPYFQWDAYSNPEMIGTKKYGGDDEAGLSDDNKFTKGTAGVVFRPVPTVALKVDGSLHRYRLNGHAVSYPEIRFDLSYAFGF